MKLFHLLFISIFLFSTAYSSAVSSESYYEVLGVSKDASQAEIKKAYNKFVKEFHPDLQTDPKAKEKATQKLLKANAAFEVLGNPEKRNLYDKHGHKAFTESSNPQKNNDPFFETFKNIFVKTDLNKKEERTPPSDKALHLFIRLLTHIKENKKENQRLKEITLKNLLEEVNISDLKKETHKRILQDLYRDFFEKKELIEIIAKKELMEITEEKELIEIIEKKDLIEIIEFSRTALLDFTDNIEERYSVKGKITASERKAIELFHKFSFINQNHKDFLKDHNRYIQLLDK